MTAHKDNTLEGRFLVGFVAMSILCELRRLMRQPTKLEQEKGPVKDIQPLSTDSALSACFTPVPARSVGWKLPASSMKLHIGSDFLISTKRSLNGYLDSTDVGG